MNTPLPASSIPPGRRCRWHWRARMGIGCWCSRMPAAIPWNEFSGNRSEPGYFLRLAIAAAGALGQVHRRGLIHKDVKPANLLVDAAGNVRLTGFGIASRLPRERQTPAPLEVIAGTFAYMAPEQTGRMNRSIDARSDLYSLGVTLYEMVTGTLPSPPPTPWSGSIVTSPGSRCPRTSGSAASRRRSRASS